MNNFQRRSSQKCYAHLANYLSAYGDLEISDLYDSDTTKVSNVVQVNCLDQRRLVTANNADFLDNGDSMKPVDSKTLNPCVNHELHDAIDNERKLISDKSSNQSVCDDPRGTLYPRIEVDNKSLRITEKNVIFEASSFINNRGLELGTYKWIHRDKSSVVGIVFLCHSYTAHTIFDFFKHQGNKSPTTFDELKYWKPKYNGSWVSELFASNFDVYSIDHESHGRSCGWNEWRCNVQHFKDFVESYVLFIARTMEGIFQEEDSEQISNQNKGNIDKVETVSDQCHTNKEKSVDESRKKGELPVFIIGYSMGGNIALQATHAVLKENKGILPKVAQRLRGVVLLAPMLRILMDISSELLLRLSGLFLQTVAPNVRLLRPESDREKLCASGKTKRKCNTSSLSNVSSKENGRPSLNATQSSNDDLCRSNDIYSQAINCESYILWWFDSDPYTYTGNPKARMICQMYQATRRLRKLVKQFPSNLRVLIFQGDCDSTVDARAAHSLKNTTKMSVEVRVLPGASHCLTKLLNFDWLPKETVNWFYGQING